MLIINKSGGRMRRKSSILLGVVALLTVILAACTGVTAPDEVLLPDAPSADDSVIGGDQSEAVGEPEVKQPRVGLEATDPSTVVLASGEPQIVEFFAYW
jgi:hypothetical protein